MSTTAPPADAPPAAVAPSATRRQSSDAATAYLDILRAGAANLVVMAHVILIFFNNQVHFRGRGLAVAMLFILSGFLITQSLLNRARRPGPHLPNFMADRIARIMTPLVPVVCLIALLNLTVIQTRMGGDGLSTGFVALIGNLLMLLDHPVFQALSLAGVDVSSWRIRPYNTAEPYWTVAIEFWLYVVASLLVFSLLMKEKVRGLWIWGLAAVSVPVLLWNAADGPGKSLSFIWIFGGLAGMLVHSLGRNSVGTRSRWLWLWIAGSGAVALAARLKALGFDPYDLQTAALVTTIFVGLYLRLNRVEHMPKLPARFAAFLGSYSYSLYLVHNTALVIVWENTKGLPVWASVAIGVVLAHVCALIVHHAFEKHHRAVGTWLRPRLNRLMLRPDALPAKPSPSAPPTPTPAEVSGLPPVPVFAADRGATAAVAALAVAVGGSQAPDSPIVTGPTGGALAG